MKLYSWFLLRGNLFLRGIFLLTMVFALSNQAVAAEDWSQRGQGRQKRGNTAADLLAQRLRRVTGVEVVQTDEGLELILKTVAGSERLVPLILPEGNDLVIDILDATLAFSIRNGVTELNPAPGISQVTVNSAESNSIRVRITGANQTPSAELVTGKDDLVLSITPEGSTAQSEPDKKIEVIATGEGEAENDDYVVPDATTATRTDTPLKDIPQSIQVVPQQVIEDQQANRLEDVVRNVSGVSAGDSFGDSTERFVIRGFAQDTTLVNGFRQGAFRQAFPSLERLERVEVLKGPASILYGNLEPGGVVNLVTKKPLSEPFVETSIELGNFGLFQSSFDFSDAVDSDKTLLYRLNANFEVSDGFRDFEQDTTRVSLSPTISWQIGENTDLLVDFNYTDRANPFDRGIVAIGDDVADIPFDRIFQQPDDEYELEQLSASYQLEHRFSDKWKLRNNFRFVSSDTSNFTLDSLFIDDSGILERGFRRNEDLSENYAVQTNTEDNDFPVGNRLENVPENSASLWTTYQIQQGSLQGFGLGAGVFFVGDRQGDLDNTFTLPSYVRTDAALFYRRDDWQANLNFQNLFDVDYIRSSETFREYLRPGDPFTVIGSVSYEF